MLAWLAATMLMLPGQDAATLRVPPPPVAREFDGPQLPPWAPTARIVLATACPMPAKAEIVPYERLPAEVLADLRRTDPQISPPGGPFSATDAWDGTSPFTRIIAALRHGDRLAVAYERGGRGYGITVLTYEVETPSGLMIAKGLHALNARETRSGRLTINDACEAMEQAVG